VAKRNITAVAVFCGSNSGGSSAFAEGARSLGRTLAEQGVAVVYGGTAKGLMACVADAALAAGGEVHGVITSRLHSLGHTHSGLTSLEIMPTLRSRKERMAARADAFIALPGGIGTLEEFMEVWAMNQLGEIDKSAGLLDTEGFYSKFLGFIDHMVATSFLPLEHRQSIAANADPVQLLADMRAFERVTVPKWLPSTF